jgi:hypothetical protein
VELVTEMASGKQTDLLDQSMNPSKIISPGRRIESGGFSR